MAKVKLKESQIQRTIIEWLAWNKIFSWRNNSGAFVRDNHFYKFGDAGSPDIFAVHKGVVFGIEVKREGGMQSPAQKLWQRELEKAGGVYLIARSIADVEIVLRWVFSNRGR